MSLALISIGVFTGVILILVLILNFAESITKESPNLFL